MDLLLSINWFAVGQIILIDILLGGDNAIVIALACRNLPSRLRRGILLGTFGAVAIRVLLIAFAVTMLQVPYLKKLGGALLFWIGIKLLIDEDDGHAEIHASNKLFAAVKTIIIADLVMSFDNVVAVAAAADRVDAEHRMLLVVFGILVSIPIIIWGSTLVLKLMGRVPFIVTLGAGLLGYISGAMAVSDMAVQPWIQANLPLLDVSLPGMEVHVSVPGLAAAVAVVVAGGGRPEADQA